MRIHSLGITLAFCGALNAWPQAAPTSPGRGELLYTTHCVACHDSQMHWRDKRVVKDWAGLTANVRRWQDQARLNWSDEDIAAVARYLNRRYYRLADTPARLASEAPFPSGGTRPLPSRGKG